ncbi:amino acid ABC transporter substrate-binding protein [Cyanobacterium sp. uoEpiScrs1]|uniref:amino acid ABC transporter substrate-binding protein n=1 Tax=Cyanobacterium sp. uoEpiScrs1 TaxID=2976343 RepID=UPI00226A9E73|nr:amino acid ABC transporter substrate-binding protein [Cyanobacterium sp. uoEpiScrs1]
MKNKLALIILVMIFTATRQSISLAGGILEKIKQNGVINAGTSRDSIPFSYINDQGEWVGYSLDILEVIRKDIQKKIGEPIKLNLVEVTAKNRLSFIQNRNIDIECSSTTVTWKRSQTVDFTVSYFASGTKILVKKGSELETIETLAGRKIGVITKTTNERVIQQQQPAAKLVRVKDHNDGLKKLEEDKIDAFAGDGIILEGLKKESRNPSLLKVVPEFPYAYESYACMVPQDESAWRNIVDYSLVKFMQGIVSDQPETVSVYEKWFGEETGITPYSREAINDYFQGIINSYEWVPLIRY